ncbi:MAG TPA: hypothetical protein VF384_07270 [Planctomycetota bacterium]
MRRPCLASLALFAVLVACANPPVERRAAAPAPRIVAAEPPIVATQPTVRCGRLVDVYGEAGPGGRAIAPGRREVIVAPAAIETSGCLLQPNPDDGRARLLVPHAVDTPAFAAAVEHLAATAEPLAESAPADASFTVSWPGIPAAELTVELSAPGGTPLPVRTALHGEWLCVDPVVLGTAALRSSRAASGLPAGPMQLVVRHANGSSLRQFAVAGRLDGAEPPRLVGELDARLASVARRDDRTWVLTLLTGNVRHPLDRGDVLRLHDAATGLPCEALEVLADAPAADMRTTHVLVHDEGRLDLERFDPSHRADLPQRGAARELFLQANAPRVTIVAPFEPERGDDAANFVRLGEGAVSDTDGNRRNVPTHVAFTLRFQRPVDNATLGAVTLRTMLAPVPHQVPVRIVAADETGTVFRFVPPLGLPMQGAMRAAIRAARKEANGAFRADYTLQVAGGPGGLRSPGGTRMAADFVLGLAVDLEAADNAVAWGVWKLP